MAAGCKCGSCSKAILSTRTGASSAGERHYCLSSLKYSIFLSSSSAIAIGSPAGTICWLRSGADGSSRNPPLQPGSTPCAERSATAFTFKGKPIDVRKIGGELGVRYVIEGSARSAGDLLRLNVQLTDAESGAHLWADRFDTDPVDLAQTQSEIIGRLARTINFKLVEAAGLSIEREKVLDPEPCDLLIHGWATLSRPISLSNRCEALRIFEQVLEIDEDSAAGKIGVAYVLICNIGDGWSTTVQKDKTRAEQLLLEAIECDANNVRARAALGFLRRLQNRLDESRIELETAIDLVPNYAPAFCQLGMTLICLGRPEAAIAKIEKGLRLSPHDPTSPTDYSILSQAHLLLGHAEPAIELARKACAGNPRPILPTCCSRRRSA